MEKNLKKAPEFRQVLWKLRQPIKEANALWEDARFILADIPLNPNTVKPILPFGMRLGRRPMGTLFIVDYRKAAFTIPYKEAALLIHVRTPLGAGVHCPWMVVDDDTALIYGRELLGYPKKMAEIEFNESEDSIQASVIRRGVKVVDIEAALKGTIHDPPPVFNVKTFNVCGPGQFQLFNLIWMFRPKERILEARQADIKMDINASESDPIIDLISGTAENGRMVVMDILKGTFTLPVGFAGPRWYVFTHGMRTK